MNEVMEILNIYKKTYNELLAIPVIRGKKTENEKFAGADCTYTIEGYIPVVGKGIQAATSHCLGQNFSKMFDISYDDADKTKKFVWQNSWGFTTRSLGIMLMNHGDDKGAIIPPFVAPVQIVIIPIPMNKRGEEITNKCIGLFNVLKTKYRVEIDTSDHKPGWKFNKWELQGVSLRIEIGPRDVDKNTVTLCKRNDFTKSVVINDINIFNHIDTMFTTIHNELYTKATVNLMENISTPSNKNEFEEALNNKKLCYVNWCQTETCEKLIKENNKAKALCIPLDLDIKLEDGKCCVCEADSTQVVKVLFGRSY